MKKFLLIILTAFVLSLSSTMGAFAANTNSGFFADEVVVDILASKQNAEVIADYKSLFGTYDVEFDFAHVLPYSFVRSESGKTIAEITEKTNTYYVGVLDYSDSFVGFAEFALKDGKWQINSVVAGDYYEKLYQTITDENLMAVLLGNKTAYLAGDEVFNAVIFVFPSEKQEVFFNYDQFYYQYDADVKKAGNYFNLLTKPSWELLSWLKKGKYTLQNSVQFVAGDYSSQDPSERTGEEIDVTAMEEDSSGPFFGENGEPIDGSGSISVSTPQEEKTTLSFEEQV